MSELIRKMYPTTVAELKEALENLPPLAPVADRNGDRLVVRVYRQDEELSLEVT